MNRQLNRLAVASIVLLVALVVATTYWQTWASAGLQDKQDNAIQRVVQFSIRAPRDDRLKGAPSGNGSATPPRRPGSETSGSLAAGRSWDLVIWGQS